MQEKQAEEPKILILVDSEFTKIKYRKPQFVEAGKIEEITHGSREKESDEPDSGHHGD